MEKYHDLQEITNEFLHGRLSKLMMEYDDEVSTIVDVLYEDDNEYSFDYKIEVDNHSKKVKFLTHFCEYGRDHIDLKRNKTFELAVSKYLFGS